MEGYHINNFEIMEADSAWYKRNIAWFTDREYAFRLYQKGIADNLG
jgi:hypothetical protein